ncbi:MAG: hypothetical protein VKI81_10545, partial [Synechococcaceae cyanobacterium]|nr:hypothetical protein [Synechococcaceae cyanobacterium]
MLTSAALASSIGAAILCVLALYLNPTLGVFREALPLALCLFLPWAAAGTVGLLAVAGLARLVRWWPRPQRSVVDGRP